MSRIGKKSIAIPAQVKVAVEGRHVRVEGPKGKLAMELPACVTAKVADNHVSLAAQESVSNHKAFHGLARSLVNNMVLGVSLGFQKKLEIQGVGFKAAVQGKNLNLSIGFSHPVIFPIPADIKITVTENTQLQIDGPDKQKVGEVAASIRRFYPPEPYKGKGIRYVGERVRHKEGKTVQ
jgi:large subunit ribosomal protein L6